MPGFDRASVSAPDCPCVLAEGGTEDTGGMVKPGGTVSRPAPPGALPPPEAGGGFGELAANTLPMLKEKLTGQFYY